MRLPIVGQGEFALLVPDLNAYFTKRKSPAPVVLRLSPDPLTLINQLSKIHSPMFLLTSNPAVFIDTLDRMLTFLEKSVCGSGGIFAVSKLPLIGSALRPALSRGGSFFSSFHSQLIDRLRVLTQNVGAGGSNSIVDILAHEMDVLFDRIGIKLNPTALRFTGDRNFTASTTQACNQNLDVCKAVELVVSVGNSFRPSFPINFDLGLGDLPLELDVHGQINLVIGWELRVGFGE